ncbi:MAG: hypothetical protein AAGG80_04005 [Pseudomonadota bacterium]
MVGGLKPDTVELIKIEFNFNENLNYYREKLSYLSQSKPVSASSSEGSAILSNKEFVKQILSCVEFTVPAKIERLSDINFFQQIAALDAKHVTALMFILRGMLNLGDNIQLAIYLTTINDCFTAIKKKILQEIENCKLATDKENFFESNPKIANYLKAAIYLPQSGVA